MTRREINRRWYQSMSPETKEAYLQKRRDYREKKPYRKEQMRAWNLKAKYGLTPEDYDNMLAAQNGLCAICTKKPKTFHVDHDHDTGKVRGLLCQKCNILLGQADEKPEILIAAIDYLKKSW